MFTYFILKCLYISVLGPSCRGVQNIFSADFLGLTNQGPVWDSTFSAPLIPNHIGLLKCINAIVAKKEVAKKACAQGLEVVILQSQEMPAWALRVDFYSFWLFYVICFSRNISIFEREYGSVWKSGLGTGKRPRPDLTWPDQDCKWSRPVRTEDHGLVYSPLQPLKFKDQSQPVFSASKIGWNSVSLNKILLIIWI